MELWTEGMDFWKALGGSTLNSKEMMLRHIHGHLF